MSVFQKFAYPLYYLVLFNANIIYGNPNIWRINISRLITKGQIISKRLLVSSDSSRKQTNKFGFFFLTVLKTNLFVRFLEEFEDTKKSFWNYLTFSELKKQIVKPNYFCKLKLKISAKTKYKLLNLNEGMTFWLKTSCWSFERISSKTRYVHIKNCQFYQSLCF